VPTDSRRSEVLTWRRIAFGTAALASLALSVWLLFLQVENYYTSDGSFGLQYRTNALFHRGYHHFWVFDLSVPYWLGVLLAAAPPIWWLADKQYRETRTRREGRASLWHNVMTKRSCAYVLTASALAAAAALTGFGHDQLFRPISDEQTVLASTTFFGPPAIFFACAALIGLRPDPAERRRSRGQCVACAYNLTGNVSGTCPECGTVAQD
jgi:hypothetical protein